MSGEIAVEAVGPTVGAINIGSNSIKMTVGRPGQGHGLSEIAWSSEAVRLGAGLDATGRLADDRIEAAMATLRRFAAEARALGAERVVAVATEAARAAANGPSFLARIERETGIEVRVVDGDEEAALTFRGLAATTDVSGSVLVADIGGASSELIVARDGIVRGARSLPIGSGRLADRLTPSDPPSREEIAACRTAAAAAFAIATDGLEVPVGSTLRLIVVGGTGEYLARLVPDPRRIGPAAIEAVLVRVRRIPAADLARQLGIAKARSLVLPAGIAMIAALVDRVRPGQVEVAHSGIRAGLLLDAFADARAAPTMPGAGGETAMPAGGR